jgi:hypothetical protein
MARIYILGFESLSAVAINDNVLWQTDMFGTINWTFSAGTPTSATGATVFWTAPASGGFTVRITATNGTDTAIKDVQIVDELFSYNPSLAVEGSLDDTTLLHTMDDGGRRGRLKAFAKLRYELKFNNRSLSEYGDAISLFRANGKLLPFLMDDPVNGQRRAWYFDSAINYRYGARGCSIDYSFRVVEA